MLLPEADSRATSQQPHGGPRHPKFGNAVLEAAEAEWFRRAQVAASHRRFLGLVALLSAVLLVAALASPLIRLRGDDGTDASVGLWDVTVRRDGVSATETRTVCNDADRRAHGGMCAAIEGARAVLIMAVLCATVGLMLACVAVDPDPFVRPGQFKSLQSTCGIQLHWEDFVMPVAYGGLGLLAFGLYQGSVWGRQVDALKSEYFVGVDRVWVTVHTGWWLLVWGAVWPLVIMATRLGLPDLDTDAWIFLDTSSWLERREDHVRTDSASIAVHSQHVPAAATPIAWDSAEVRTSTSTQQHPPARDAKHKHRQVAPV
jgi:hypothetical protein